MSQADENFIKTAEEIFREGTSTEKEQVRPKWEDGTPAHTKKIFGVMNVYNLMPLLVDFGVKTYRFPLLTIRPVPLKLAVDEILWIYQKKSNNINDLKSHIWDAWADENGSIGNAYGYQIGQKTDYGNGLILDQMDKVLYDLKHTPFSRRIITNTYVHNDLPNMRLYPCAYSTTWNVHDIDGDKPALDLMVNQRSHDLLVANGWNVAQYAALLMMVAQVSNMYAGKLYHVIGDTHIYDRHEKIVKELIERPVYPDPIVKLNPDIKNFYDFTVDDFEIENYEHGEQIKNIPVAV